MQPARSPLSVCASLAGKRILLTGATGFLAKVVLEKLIRTVPDIGCLILPIRSTGSAASAHERFEREIASSSIFDRLRSERPDWLRGFFANRIECLGCEITEAGFGLPASRFIELAGKVDVIINAAASVNFREPLDAALRINTLSLHHLTALARAADAPLIQVSTCYVNGFHRGDMHEEMVAPAGAAIPRHRDGHYDVGGLYRALSQKIARIKNAGLDPLQEERKLTDLGIRAANRYGWNDTYTFTKWLGEQIAIQGMQGRTLTIVRPAIIESTLQEPVPGWIEGVKVADAIILAYARGKTRFFPAQPNEIIDIIPADLVANSIVLATAEALQVPGAHRIYQCCSGSSNPVRLGEVIGLLEQESKRNWRRYDKLFYREPTHDFRVVHHRLFRLILAAIRFGTGTWRTVRALTGARRESAALEAVRTTRMLALTFSFYTQPRYRFHNRKLLALAQRFGVEGDVLFPVDPATIGWEDYLCRVHMAGLNRYALRRTKTAVTTPPAVVEETPVTTEAAAG
ncbi:dehydrogenase [Noviherbaspirillum saxi]|uniref:Dehydrogenase n=2 Tax=Noviherbaspirillum saxi TaxID=2320863 RepID=A0A3A3FVS9_9BURK|nr:dehydrogenase [Noviherbaspirillum saxi]